MDEHTEHHAEHHNEHHTENHLDPVLDQSVSAPEQAGTDWKFWWLLAICAGLVTITLCTGAWAYSQIDKIGALKGELALQEAWVSSWKMQYDTVSDQNYNLRRREAEYSTICSTSNTRVAITNSTFDGLDYEHFHLNDNTLSMNHVYIMRDDDPWLKLLGRVKTCKGSISFYKADGITHDTFSCESR